MIEGDNEADDPFTMEEFVEFLEETMDAMPSTWDRIGKLAVLFGACIDAAKLSDDPVAARRALARFQGGTEWWKASKPLPGEKMQ